MRKLRQLPQLRASSTDRTIEAQQFLSCIARLAQRRERFGAAYLIDILRGSQSQRLIDNGHAQLSVYGIGKQHSIDTWRRVARALLHQGLVQETQDGYSVLSPQRDQLGKSCAESAKYTSPRHRPHHGVSRTTSGGADELHVADQPLFDKLRALRKKLADQSGVPPYVIFHDATLREMVRRAPATLAEFANIPGWARPNWRATAGYSRTKSARPSPTLQLASRHCSNAARPVANLPSPGTRQLRASAGIIALARWAEAPLPSPFAYRDRFALDSPETTDVHSCLG